MFRFLKETLFVFFLLGMQSGYANVEMSLAPPDEAQKHGQPLPDISFFDEENQKVNLPSTQDNAFLLVPFYAHCKSTCPLNVAHLKDVLKKSSNQDYKVILFSFNPDDTSEDLKEFRRALQVPTAWSIFRASPKDTNTLLETLDFRYMTQGVDFIHSNTIVVLSPALKIVKFIQGLGYTARTIDQSIQEARRLKNKILISLPLVAFVIFALILGALFFWVRQEGRKRTQGIQA